MVDGGEEVFGEVRGEGEEVVEVGGCVGGGEAAEEVAVGGVGQLGGGLGEGGWDVQGAVELVRGHGCGCLKEGGRGVGFRWCSDGPWLPAVLELFDFALNINNCLN